MKQDYIVEWTATARAQLLAKVNYIKQQSKNPIIAQKFYDEIKYLTEKLSLVASAYDSKKFKIIHLKNGHRVKFLVSGDCVYIVAFLPKGKH